MQARTRSSQLPDRRHVTDTRWPRFAAAAEAHGVRSMLGYKLFTSGRTLGALDLYSSKLNAFDADSEVVGELFAAHAAIALIGSTQQAEWQSALDSRDTIGMAKGILMQRERISDDQAFNLLVSTSQKANIKLHDLADLVGGQRQQHRDADPTKPLADSAATHRIGALTAGSAHTANPRTVGDGWCRLGGSDGGED